MNYLKETIKNLVDSLKLRKRFYFATIIDIIFLFLIIAANMVITISINVKMSEMQNYETTQYFTADIMNIEHAQQLWSKLGNPEFVQQMMSIKEGFTYVLALMIISILVSIILYIISRALIWQFLVDEKNKTKSFWKYSLTNLLLVLIMAILASLVYLLINEAIKPYLLLFLLIYYVIFASAANTFLEKTGKLWKSTGKAIISSFKIKYFIIPLTISLLTLFLISAISIPILELHLIMVIIPIILFTFYSQWTKQYLNITIKNSKFYKTIKQ
jgi:hypothetical protein